MSIKQWQNDAALVAKYYTDKIADKGFTAEVLAARDKKYADMFFDELLNGVSIKSDNSILDIGSGLGLLIPYLSSKGIFPNDYLGVDLIQSFIDYSAKTYPRHKFIVGNFISEDFIPKRKFDVVIALGVLVSRVSDYEKYVREFISKMVNVSNEYVLFNLVTEVDVDSPNYKNKGVIGGITPIGKEKIEEVLNSITGIEYEITEKNVFEDATDAFIQIRVDPN